MLKTFSIGGIHPSDKKISKDCRIEVLPLPSKVFISVAQHLGAPATPVVKAGDQVKVGQVIAEPAGFISAYVHSSVSGTVKSVGPRKDLAGNYMTHIEIDVEGDEWAEGIDLSEELVTEIPEDNKAILEKIKLNGVVGLGGATFPAHVKLCPPPGKKADCLILNGAECEPYLTSDYRIMLERSKEIIVGAAIMKQVLGGCPAVIGIEENKPEAIKVMKEALAQLQASAKGYESISVMPLKKKYPQGGEKQLIDAVMKRQVKSMGLPIDVGAVVQNVATSLAVYEAVQKNKPLIERVVTITGETMATPRNLLTRMGTPITKLVEMGGGLKDGDVKVVNGGPMMGRAMVNMDSPVTKGCSGVTVYSGADAQRVSPSPCIKCAKCVAACPMSLEPYLISKLAKKQMWERLEEEHITDCIECGCCQFTCPAGIALLDYVRLGKQTVMGIIRARAAANAPKK